MKVVMLYQPNSEHSRTAEDFARDMQREHQTRVELADVNTREGLAKAELYDIRQYPAVLILRDDGQIIKDWQGSLLPLKSEVSLYTHM